MAAKALFQIVIDAKTGQETLVKLKQDMKEFGEASEQAGAKLSKQEKDMTALINKLEPARVATEKLTDQQRLLKDALVVGKFGEGTQAIDRYKAALDALNQKQTQTTTQTVEHGSAIDVLHGTYLKLAAQLAVVGTVFAAVGKGWLDVTRAAMGDEVASAKLLATWTATKGASGATIVQLHAMAESLAALTGRHREEVKEAEALALTYHNVTGPALERMLKSAADLAAVRGGDLPDWVTKLGRAMENPSSGLTALTRAGVVFTQQQKEQIKVVSESGDTLTAMALILERVESSYGGAAARIGATTQGAWDRLTASLNELKETWGGMTLGATKEALSETNDAVIDLTDNTNRMRAAWNTFFETIGAGQGIWEAFKKSYVTRRGLSEEQLELPGPVVPSAMQSIEQMLGKTGLPGMGMTSLEIYKQATGAFVEAQQAEEKAIEIKKKHEEQIKRMETAYQKLSKQLQEVGKSWQATASLLFKPDWAMQAEFTTQLSDRFTGLGKMLAVNLGTGLNAELPASFAGIAPAVEASGLGLALQQSIGTKVDEGVQGGIVSGMKEGIAEAAPAFSKEFADAFKDGLLALFESGDLKSAWGALTAGFVGMFSQALGNAMQTLFAGGSIADIGKATGLWTPGTTGEGPNKPGQFNWAGAASMIGGILGQLGTAQANRGLATIGGAMSGAGMGFMMGGGMGAAAGVGAGAASGAAAGSAFPVWGTIIGAVVGAALAYLGSKGPSKESAQMGLRGGLGYVTEITGGVSKEAERQVAQEITDRYRTTAFAFRDILHALGQAVGEMPDITLAFNEKSKNLQSAIQAFISGTVPRAVFEAFRPALELGLASVGVSVGRITEEMTKFSTGDFDKTLLALKEYVTVLLRLQNLHKDLGKSLDDLRTELTQSVRDTWKQMADESLTEIQRLSEGLSSLTSEEQVMRANQIADLAEAQYEANLQYLGQLAQMQITLSKTYEATFAGLEEQRAGTGGPESLGAFYMRKMEELRAQLQGATGPEMIQEITQQLIQYGQALWKLNLPGIYGTGQQTPFGEAVPGSQEWVEQFLKQAQTITEDLLKGWQDEIKAQNDALQAALTGITTALTSETSLRDGLMAKLQDETSLREGLNLKLGEGADILEGFNVAVAGVTARLAGLEAKAGSMQRWG